MAFFYLITYTSTHFLSISLYLSLCVLSLWLQSSQKVQEFPLWVIPGKLIYCFFFLSLWPKKKEKKQEKTQIAFFTKLLFHVFRPKEFCHCLVSVMGERERGIGGGGNSLCVCVCVCVEISSGNT